MKLLLSLVFAAVALSGCASAPPAPTEPGSGRGLSYVPMVDMSGVDRARYQADVADCRTAATRIAARTEDNDGMWAALGLGLITVHGQGIAGAAAWTGFAAVIADMSARPPESVVAEHQQIAVVHCMAKRGYRNLDPNVRDSFYAYGYSPVESFAPRRTGVDTFNVERLAKNGRCNAQPRAELTAKGPGYEAYQVPCENGGNWAVRCEFGQCRVLAMAPVRRS